MFSWAIRIFNKIEEYQKKRADFLLLQMLSDRELHDLGIARGSIREIIYGDQEGHKTSV